MSDLMPRIFNPVRSLLLPLILVTIFLAVPNSAFCQAWSGVIAPSRAITWTSAGLPATFPDGETTTNPWTPPVRTQSGSTISPSGNAATDLSNIQAALGSCSGKYILLGAGTFLIQGPLNLSPVVWRECTIRGSGPQSTTLSFSGSGVFYMGTGSSGGSCPLSSGSNFSAGSTTITCGTVTGSALAIGDIVTLIQCDTGYSGYSTSTGACSTGSATDNGAIFTCGGTTTCNSNGNGPGNSHANQTQIFYVTNVSGSVVTLNAPLYMPNWAFGQSATLTWNNPSVNGFGNALEDLTVLSTSVTADYTIYMANTFGSWVKGVRFIGGNQDALALQSSKNDLISNNYCVAVVPANNGNFLGCLHENNSSDSLILNNIYTYGQYEEDGGAQGEVFAYNYMNWFFTQYLLTTRYPHEPFSAFNLQEGNQMQAVYEDDTWGTHALGTSFRNNLPCYDVPYTTYGLNSSRAMSIAPFQRFINAIGNAMGSSFCSTYQSNSNGAAGLIYYLATSDPLTTASFMRWGNVSTVQQSSDTPANSGIRFVAGEVPNSTNMPSGTYPNASTWQNPTPSNNNLPCDLYFAIGSTPCSVLYSGGTGLSFWKVCKTWTTFPTSCSTAQTQPFPIAGPDVTSGPYINGHAYDIPAAVAWQYLPIDTNYQVSYTITASSWSGGIETLTVSGLPSTICNSGEPGAGCHMEGPFQPSGLASGCTSGATFGNNGEIQITGSTATTVSYALGSGSPDNGSSNHCIGTNAFKFPDIRQFDERVYENDPAGSTVATPTFSPVAGSYGPAQTVTISDSPSGATLCYTVNGSTPTAATPGTCDSNGGVEFTYSSAITVSSTETVNAIGTLASYTNSSVGSATYTINGSAPTPTFSPVAGTYSGSQNVTISDSLGGATICFTTDGSTPTANGAGVCTHGSTYSATVAVTVSMTIKAIASESGYSDSSVASGTFTILSVLPNPGPAGAFMGAQ